MIEATNHEEAYLFSHYKRHESNLARCYLSIKEQRDELLEACEDFVSAVRAGSKQEIMLAINAADKKARAAITKAKGME